MQFLLVFPQGLSYSKKPFLAKIMSWSERHDNYPSDNEKKKKIMQKRFLLQKKHFSFKHSNEVKCAPRLSKTQHGIHFTMA